MSNPEADAQIERQERPAPRRPYVKPEFSCEQVFESTPLCAKISETPSRPAFSVGGGEGSTHEDEGKWCKWYCSASPRFCFAPRWAEGGAGEARRKERRARR